MDSSIRAGTLVALLVPIVLIEVGFLAFALIDLKRRKRVKGGNKLVWAAAIVLLGFVGPLAYPSLHSGHRLVLEREEER